MRPLFAATFASLITLTSFASEVCGCTIPVFRYALDRWEADKFELLLPASVAADPTVSDLLRPIRANSIANLSIRTAAADAAIDSPELRTARLGGQRLWSGPLDAATLGQILDSPARQQLLSRILAGDSAVWVIAHGDSPEDIAQAERIEKRLRFLEQVAALPIQDPNDPDSQLGPGPELLLKFTSLRLNRNDPAEQLFLKMLAGPSGKIDPASTSFAAAVFGRGRVLGAWALDQLDDASIEEASMFLVGRCSCRVKDQNPGWDILMNLDWDAALRKVATTTAATPAAAPAEEVAATFSEPQSAAETVTVTTTPDSPPAGLESGAAATLPRWATLGGTVLLVVIALLLLRPRP